MTYEDLTPEQKIQFDGLKIAFDEFTKSAGKMNATLYPQTLQGFEQHALKCELLLEKIIDMLLKNKHLAEIAEGKKQDHENN